MGDMWDSTGGQQQTWAVHVCSWYDVEQGGQLGSIDVRFLEPPPPELLAGIIQQLAEVAPAGTVGTVRSGPGR